MKARKKLVNVKVTLPLEVLEKIRAIAKIAGVTPTQVYNVMFATHLVSSAPAKRKAP